MIRSCIPVARQDHTLIFLCVYLYTNLFTGILSELLFFPLYGIYIIVGFSVAYNFQTGNNKIKLLTEYEGVTQKVLFGNAVLAALMSGRKYDVIPQNGDCSRESSVRTSVFRNKVRYQNATSLQNSVWKRSTFR
jgi:hypothetical protein